MDEETLRNNIAKNIAFYRKLNNHTQAELAEKISYSDKSVSKWERGEGIPDIYVLTLIAELYRVTVNDLLSSSPTVPQKGPKKILITLLSIGLVWLVVSVLYFALKLFLPEIGWLWLAFVWALPVSFIVLVVFTSMWWRHLHRCVAVSGLVWSLALCIHLLAGQSGSLIYIVAAVLQVMAVLWFLLRSRK